MQRNLSSSSAASTTDERSRWSSREPSCGQRQPLNFDQFQTPPVVRDGHRYGDSNSESQQVSEPGSLSDSRRDSAWRSYTRQRSGAPTSYLDHDGSTARRLLLLERHRQSQQASSSASKVSPTTDNQEVEHQLLVEDNQNSRNHISASSRNFGPPSRPQNATVQRNHSPSSTDPDRGASSYGSFELPKWQPDDKISECPICGATFTFWYRKHHCRKCGRVVCAGCSPHRITIPRQYIVHPPEMQANTSPMGPNLAPEVIDLTGDDEAETTLDHRALQARRQIPNHEGGEEVRLCNPCVPDPNPMPHTPRMTSTLDAFSNRRSNAATVQNALPNEVTTMGSHGMRPPPSLSTLMPRPSTRPNRFQAGLFGSSLPLGQGSNFLLPRTPQPFLPQNSTQNLDLGRGFSRGTSGHHDFHGPSERYRAFNGRHRPHASLSHVPSPARTFDPFDFLSTNPQSSPQPAPSYGQPQLKEEDECPVCHLALPPLGPDGSEKHREAHVAACVNAHFSGSGGSLSRHPMPAITGPSTSGSLDTNQRPSGTMSAPLTGRVRSHGSAPRRQTTGMVVYNATEKDCVGSDGETEAECVICFEEFTVGEEMGRLECLCKFHHKCIRQWWSTKGPGMCPVHQHAS